MNDKQHKVIDYIANAIYILDNEGDSDEDGRTKAIVKTKLEEALLWSARIYNPIKVFSSKPEDK